MILALNGRGEVIQKFNDNGTKYEDPDTLGIFENDVYFPNSGGSGGTKTTFDKIFGGVVNVLQVLFPTGVKSNNTPNYDPYTPAPQTGGGTTSTFSGLGWVVAILVLMYFLFSGKKKS